MRHVVVPFVIGVAIGAALFLTATLLDPHVPLTVPVWPGFLIQRVARATGFVAPNRMLFWATPLGWGLVALIFMWTLAVFRRTR